MLRKLHSAYTSRCSAEPLTSSLLYTSLLSFDHCIISGSPADDAGFHEVTAGKAVMSDSEETTSDTLGEVSANTGDDGFILARKRKSKKIAPLKDDTDSGKTDPAMVRLKDDSIARPTSSKGSSVGFVGGQPSPEEGRDRRFSADRLQESEIVSGSGKGRTKGLSPLALLPSTMRFFSGNPMVETTEGIIHLYKDR